MNSPFAWAVEGLKLSAYFAIIVEEYMCYAIASKKCKLRTDDIL